MGLEESLGTLIPVHPCLVSDSMARKEREVMLRLKKVVDRQRDELRAQAHEIVCKSRDTEAVRAWELRGVVCQGPGDLLSCHIPPGAVTAAEPAGAGGTDGPAWGHCLTFGCPGPSSCRNSSIASWP